MSSTVNEPSGPTVTVETLEITAFSTVKVADAVSFGAVEVSFPVAMMLPVSPPSMVSFAVNEPVVLAFTGLPEMVTEDDEKLTVTLALNPVPVTVTAAPGSPLLGLSEIEGLIVAVVVVLCAKDRGEVRTVHARAARITNADLFNWH